MPLWKAISCCIISVFLCRKIYLKIVTVQICLVLNSYEKIYKMLRDMQPQLFFCVILYKNVKGVARVEDNRIVELYWQRREEAIGETEKKYSRYLMKISYNILADMEDSRESVNDTYLKAWNSIPPQCPEVLSGYLARITRQVSIDRYRKRKSRKRVSSEYLVSLSELEECIACGSTPEQEMELQVLAEVISRYLYTLPEQTRNVFICRYFYMDSVKEIAAYQGAGESKIKSMLHRTRNGLKAYLEKEGFFV